MVRKPVHNKTKSILRSAVRHPSGTTSILRSKSTKDEKDESTKNTSIFSSLKIFFLFFMTLFPVQSYYLYAASPVAPDNPFSEVPLG